MTDVDDISDTTDWLNTPVSSLGAVEAGLRCHICKDFFDAPVITACSHTFCSACIRRSLSSVNAQKCPLCWSQFDERQLRKNTVVEDLVRLFQEARPQILELGRKVVESEQNPAAKKGRKRKHGESQESLGKTSPRKTRSLRRSAVVQSSVSPEPEEETILAEDKEDEDFHPDDGLAACPICQKRMPEAQVFAHLDVHQGGDEARAATSNKSLGLTTLPSRSQSSTPTMKPLPTITYHLLSETQLRKKLAELGISTIGPKQLMVRRHTEWRNIVNANCDSSNPKSKRELLLVLRDWEKAQGTTNANSTAKPSKGPPVMEKDFDRDAWSTTHGSDFRNLVAQARAKAKKAGHDDQEAKPPGDTSSSRHQNQVDTIAGASSAGSSAQSVLDPLDSIAPTVLMVKRHGSNDGFSTSPEKVGIVKS